MYTVQIFDMATGQCTAAFAGHGSSVYDVCWARDPEIDVGATSAPSTRRRRAHQGHHRVGGWRGGVVGGCRRPRPVPEQLGSDDAVAQHACECYGAAWHPHGRSSR